MKRKSRLIKATREYKLARYTVYSLTSYTPYEKKWRDLVIVHTALFPHGEILKYVLLLLKLKCCL